MRQTINWAIKRALEKAMVLAPKSHVRRLQRKLEYNPTPFKVVEAYAKENKELNYPLFEKFFERETLFGNYLCSELAWGDLSQYLEGGHADTTRKQSVLLKGMIESVNDLQENINVVHNDLHLGNFLIQSEKHPVVLMHDFGKSQVVEGKWTTEERITDLDMMVSALQAAPQLYHLTTPFQKLLQDLSEQIVSYEKAKSTYNLAPTFLNQVGSLQSYHMR